MSTSEAPDIKTLREAAAKIHRRAMGDDSIVYMSIPPRPDVDADLLLSAALDELEMLREERARLRQALHDLLMSRDCAWTSGHDWPTAVDRAIEVLDATGGAR